MKRKSSSKERKREREREARENAREQPERKEREDRLRGIRATNMAKKRTARSAAVHLGTRKKRIRHERGPGTKERTCQVADTLHSLPLPSTPFDFPRRPLLLSQLCCSPHLSRLLLLLFDDSFRYHSYKTTATAEESSFCEI